MTDYDLRTKWALRRATLLRLRRGYHRLRGVLPRISYVYVQEDTTIGGNHCLLYNFQGDVNLRIRTGKTLTLNAESPGEFRYMGAIRANDGGDVTISGGGTLEINATGSTEAVDSRSFLSGIRGSNVTLKNCTKTGFEGSPTVNILMVNRYSLPEGNKVFGISAGKLTVKDGTRLRINVYDRALNTSNDSNTGEVLMVDTSGYLNIQNDGTI